VVIQVSENGLFNPKTMMMINEWIEGYPMFTQTGVLGPKKWDDLEHIG
jgi:hypothetical protein